VEGEAKYKVGCFIISTLSPNIFKITKLRMTELVGTGIEKCTHIFLRKPKRRIHVEERNSVVLSPLANYTDLAIAASQRS
jgi:hypothetical protein